MSRWSVRALAIAAPAWALTVALAAALAGAVCGRHPMWPDHELTLSEAVVTRADADLVQLIGAGHDPHRPYDVRPGLFGDDAVRVTPLEAAVLSQDAGVLALLLTHAPIGTTAWTRLRCLAKDDDVMVVLERHRPAGAAPRCGDDAGPQTHPIDTSL